MRGDHCGALAVGSLVTLTDTPGGAVWRVLEIDGDDALIESEGGRRFWRPVARLTTVHGAFRILNPSALLKCDHCAVASINGHLCHEIGCPYMGARWDTESGTWVKQRKCRECGCQVDKGEVCCEDSGGVAVRNRTSDTPECRVLATPTTSGGHNPAIPSQRPVAHPSHYSNSPSGESRKEPHVGYRLLQRRS